MAKSLMDGMEDIGKKPDAAGKSVDSAKIVKISVAGVMLVAAAVLLAFNFGLIGGEKVPEVPSDKAQRYQQEYEEQLQEENQLIEESPRLERAGSG